MKKVNAAEAKTQLADLMAEVASGNQRVLIQQKGAAPVALVSLADLARLEREDGTGWESLGLLSLVGAWSDLSDEEIDQFIADIYASREADMGRPVELDVDD